MLDTIAINLQQGEFTIFEPEKFNPHADVINTPSKGMVKCIRNPTKEEKMLGYLPYVTLFKRSYAGVTIWLRVEFSAPKLMFGNNFEELRGAEDLEPLVEALQAGLRRMGIKTTKEALKTASISAVHYSKNFLLERDTPCHLLIQALSRLDVSAKLDLSQTEFRNSGQMVKYHANGYEVALYDKVKDLEQARKYGRKRSEERDSECQYSLFSEGHKPEVLRLEVRLKTRKIKSLLTSLSMDYEMTLASLLIANISRAVLLHYWNEITKGLYLMGIDAGSCEKLIGNIQAVYPRKRPNSVLALMAFILCCQELGVRGAKLHLRLTDAQFYRLRKDAKKLEQDSKDPRFTVLARIRKQLEDFIAMERADIVDEGVLG